LTLARNQQFENFAETFRKHRLIETIVINEVYLRGTPAEIELAKHCILIDSPGFTAETQLGKLRGNLSILKYIYNLADLTLFCIPAESIALISSQVNMLELSLLYAFHGEDTMNSVLETLQNDKGSNISFGVSDIFAVMMRQWTKSPKSAPNMKYEGANYWEKVRFVLTKIDRVKGNAEAQFFELGIALGRNLKYLTPPVFDQCFAIGLPEQQDTEVKITKDLNRLKQSISSHNFYDSYLNRLEAAIQRMCDDLKKHVNDSWYAAMYTWTKSMVSNDLTLIETIYLQSRVSYVIS